MTRWRKVWRDLGMAFGRVFMIVLAVGLSIAGIAAVMSANSILTREIASNYMSTNPAAATIETDRVDDDIVMAVKKLPNVKDAEARRSVLARAQFGDGKWQALLLFVVRDFDTMRIGRAFPDSGAWPPPAGTLLLERTVLPLFSISVGNTVTVKTPNGSPTRLSLSGTVHDPGLAPAWQERMGYGFITAETLDMLGEGSHFDELKITLATNPLDETEINKVAAQVASWLGSQGHPVHTIEMPPPGRHPHQGQMVAILTLLLVFSLLALVLSAILAASLIEGMMAKEIRYIGIMKTIGGKSSAIARMYFSWIAFICLLAFVWALPLGIAVGRTLSNTIGNLLNFTIGSNDLSWWVPLVVVLAGFVVPMSIAGIPIARASSMTPWQAIAGRRSARSIRPAKDGRSFAGVSRTLLMSLRNSFRKRGRLVLTLSLMAAGGAMFMASLNVQAAWSTAIETAFESRTYDFAIRLDKPQVQDNVKSLISSVAGVRAVEAWGYASATVANEGDIEISRTYPDGGHGSFSFVGIVPGTIMQNFELVTGSSLSEKDPDAVVLNQSAWAKYGNPAIGSDIGIDSANRELRFTLGGVVREIGPATAYVNAPTLQRTLGLEGHSRYFIVSTASEDLAVQNDWIKSLEQKLETAGYSVEAIIADSDFRDAIDGHILILIYSLLAMALIMGTVGLLGLGAATNISVLERTREIGVMRSIGGTPGAIIGNILIEGLFVGLLSFVLAVVLSMPLSAGLGTLLGNLAFQIPLPLTISSSGLGFWTAIVLAGSLGAASYPAWRASRLSIRETLAYE